MKQERVSASQISKRHKLTYRLNGERRRAMRAYTVHYKMYSADEVREISFLAENKRDAYVKATWGVIPRKEGEMPYSAWVHSTTYQNGKYRTFNTFEGNPY